MFYKIYNSSIFSNINYLCLIYFVKRANLRNQRDEKLVEIEDFKAIDVIFRSNAASYNKNYKEKEDNFWRESK